LNAWALFSCHILFNIECLVIVDTGSETWVQKVFIKNVEARLTKRGFFQNMVLILLFSFLTPLNSNSNDIPHYKLSGLCFIFSLDIVNEWIRPSLFLNYIAVVSFIEPKSFVLQFWLSFAGFISRLVHTNAYKTYTNSVLYIFMHTRCKKRHLSLPKLEFRGQSENPKPIQSKSNLYYPWSIFPKHGTYSFILIRLST
jgi:hypothetical protein